MGQPELEQGEHVAWRQRVSREQSLYRQVGGELFVTERRVIFLPNRVDYATGGKPWSCALSDIATAAVEPSRRRLLALLGRTACLRRRLRLGGRDGWAELFVINQVDKACAKFQAAIQPA